VKLFNLTDIRGRASSLGARASRVLLVMVGCFTLVTGSVPDAASAALQGGRRAPLAAGSDIYVCASGCATYDYTTIGAAVVAASSGDTIHVAEGTYGKTVRVTDKSLTILGGYSTSSWSVRDPATYVTIINPNLTGSGVRLVSTTGAHTGTIDGFTIKRGNSSGGGGGFWINGYQATISNNRIRLNQAANGAGLAISNATNVTIEDNLIEENTASQDGGGVRVYKSTVSFTGNDILDNTATANGGGINVIDGMVTIDDNTINGNVSKQYGGGGIMLRNDSVATITNSRIKLNRAVVGGGGIRIEDSQATIQGNDIMRNTTSNIGGGLTVVRSHVDVDDNDFKYNTGLGGGGGLQFSSDSTGLIENNRFVDNEAGANPGGGGVHIWRCSPQFISNTVTDNTADNAGGGVNIEDASPLVKDNVISDNHAGDHGGGVSMSVGSSPTIVDNTIASNTASVKGGGIFGYDSAPLIRRNEIVDNQAPTAGGVHLTGSVGFEVTNNIIARNQATLEGGGVHLASNSQGSIVNNTFVANNQGAAGEAISLRNSARARVANNILVNHTYGVLVKEQAAATIEYNDAWNNSIANYSGATGSTGHISCNPQFLNASAGDYHLTGGSCCIDNGTQVGAPSLDFDGDSRPMDGDGNGGALWDRGADEYQNQIWITKEVSDPIVEPGDNVSFTITYRNNSGSTVTGVVITDLLSSDLTNHGYSSTGPDITPRAGPDYVWDVEDLAPGTEGTITITAKVDNGIATPKAIVNSVTFEMTGYGPYEDEVVMVVGGLRTYVPAVLQAYE